MAKTRYFDSFPQITYGTKIARNILARAKPVSGIFTSPNAYYDYVIEHDQRPDQVAYNYYDDSNMVWLIFLVNDIVDPYYQWPLSQRHFVEFIESKYGTVTAAQSQVLHYKHNNKDLQISPDTYTLNATFQKIVANNWSPVYAYDYEELLNEEKRKIKLVDKRFATKAKEQLKLVLNG